MPRCIDCSRHLMCLTEGVWRPVLHIASAQHSTTVAPPPPQRRPLQRGKLRLRRCNEQRCDRLVAGMPQRQCRARKAQSGVFVGVWKSVVFLHKTVCCTLGRVCSTLGACVLYVGGVFSTLGRVCSGTTLVPTPKRAPARFWGAFAFGAIKVASQSYTLKYMLCTST